MSRYKKYEDLIAPWKTDPKTREGLLERIRSRAAKEGGNSENLFTE